MDSSNLQLATLGMAFASADLLFQLNGDTVEHVLGAVQAITGLKEAEVVGRPWREWIASADHGLFQAAAKGVDDGVRRGPFIIGLGSSAERTLQVTLRKSPTQPGRVCGAVVSVFGGARLMSADGLLSRPAFEQMAERLMEVARQTGQGLELAFVEVDAGKVGDGRGLVGGLRAESFQGAAAGDLGAGRYAVLRTPDGAPQNVASRLSRVLATPVAAHIVRLDGDANVQKAMRGVRLAIDRLMADGGGDLPVSASAFIEQAMRSTLGEVSAVRTAIKERRFALAFQPVVDLKKRQIVHHEVLVRFTDAESPAGMIEMAEAFDLIGELDAAVLETAISQLANLPDRSVHFAVNVSGSTVTDGALPDRLAALLKRFPKARGRLLLEMTETAVIDNLDLANRNIQALRDLGTPVCLDDFGAGSASFSYLQHLHVDVLKIDGAYVRAVVEDGREAMMIRRLVQLCQDLKIRTVAEMVETPEVEALARDAGVDYAQGWLYGRASPKPLAQLGGLAPAAAPARRQGLKESWG